jgi:hypothetical protein
MCIRFGMVSMDTDVEELLALVTRTGTDLDEQVDHFQNMEEMVRKGIQQAQSGTYSSHFVTNPEFSIQDCFFVKSETYICIL